MAPPALVGLGAALAMAACEGDTFVTVQAPEPEPPVVVTPTVVAPGEEAPLVLAEIVELRGQSGPGGEFQVGDRITVHYTLEQADGTPWLLSEMTSGEILVSGPTFNYQRVLPLATDLLSASMDLGGGAYAYTFADPLPDVYVAPYNDTPDLETGEMTGQDLLDGTYTLGLSVTWDYEVEGVGAGFRRVGETTLDFVVGAGAGAVEPRDVTRRDNCNRCHGDLQAHDGRYRELTMCLLCHTSGAEDKNDPALLSGSAGVTIDSRVLFHKIHNGRYLPSVLGVQTRINGSRNYNAPRSKYQVIGASGVRDFSNVGWPVMPNRVQPMARDVGYSTELTPAQRVQEDTIRSGVATCAVCHGDPDGSGPLQAPSQGDLVYSQMTRRACGSCHDDVDFTKSYASNTREMPPQFDDTQCIFCHAFGSGIHPRKQHLHPLNEPESFNGLNLELVSVAEAGDHDGDGVFDPGELIEVAVTIRDDEGNNVARRNLATARALISGPTWSFQPLLNVEFPPALMIRQPATGEFVFRIPELRHLELLGFATPARGEAFKVSACRIRQAVVGRLFVASTVLQGSTLRTDGVPGQNFLDLADASLFRRDDHVVIEDGAGVGAQEYLRVQLVEDDRIWFSAPNHPDYATGLSFAHSKGASVNPVVLNEQVFGTDYSVDNAQGQVMELNEFEDGGAVVYTYLTDFAVPDGIYPQALNASPDLDDSSGKWTGKGIVPGTYVLDLTVARDVEHDVFGEITTYSASSSGTRELLFGPALEIEPYDRVEGRSCDECHVDLSYHGGLDRGFDTCILCHGAGGSEDLPRYVAGSAPATTGVTVEFRTLLHRIHRGRDAADPGFTVVARGSDPYPDNFETRSYADFGFPATPGRTLQCAECHARDPLPDDHGHPAEQILPVRVWTAACRGCHDAEAAVAHMDANTAPSGAESCAICHDPGEEQDVLLVHEAR